MEIAILWTSIYRVLHCMVRRSTFARYIQFSWFSSCMDWLPPWQFLVGFQNQQLFFESQFPDFVSSVEHSAMSADAVI